MLSDTPFTPPLVELSLEWYRKKELVAAEQWIKESTGAQEVRRLQITTAAHSLRTSPVYVPVFIFRSLHFGAPLFVISPPISWDRLPEICMKLG